MSQTTRFAVVMGGGQGIGEACVRRLLADGFQVGIADLSGEIAQKLSEELNREKAVTCAFKVNIAGSEDLAALGAGLQAWMGWGGLSAAVNSAGIFHERRPLRKTPIEVF